MELSRCEGETPSRQPARRRRYKGRPRDATGLLMAGVPAGGRATGDCTKIERMYPELMLIPMREELTKAGVQELRTAAEVERAVATPGTTMVIVNSVCGCAAGRMRPAVRMALQHSSKPEHIYSVFAGQDKEATERARSYFTGYPPSSPSIAILRDGRLVYILQRSQIETREASAIAAELTSAFDRLCVADAASND